MSHPNIYPACTRLPDLEPSASIGLPINVLREKVTICWFFCPIKRAKRCLNEKRMYHFKQEEQENLGNLSKPDGTHLTKEATVGLRKNRIETANRTLAFKLKIKSKGFKYVILLRSISFCLLSNWSNKELQQKRTTMLRGHKQWIQQKEMFGCLWWWKIKEGTALSKIYKNNIACKNKNKTGIRN